MKNLAAQEIVAATTKVNAIVRGLNIIGEYIEFPASDALNATINNSLGDIGIALESLQDTYLDRLNTIYDEKEYSLDDVIRYSIEADETDNVSYADLIPELVEVIIDYYGLYDYLTVREDTIVI
jgi:hypothetical protein